jgi:hypothetical protein
MVYILMQILIFFKSKILSLKHVPIDFNPTVTDMLITWLYTIGDCMKSK